MKNLACTINSALPAGALRTPAKLGLAINSALPAGALRTPAKLGLAILLAACGTDDSSSNPCPTGDCTIAARTTVKWTFNAYPARGFPMDSCTDFGIGRVEVDVVDANGFATTSQDMCGNGQSTFSGLEPGDYTVYMMPLDLAGNALLASPVTSQVIAGVENHEVTVNVPWDAWLGAADATGTFLFRISWGGMSCETTTVKNQVLKLTVNGVVQAIATDDGQILNGSDKKPCKKLTDNFPQSALGAEFGLAQLLIEGYDALDNMMYSKTFDTFVGAGITNPTLTFDVPTM